MTKKIRWGVIGLGRIAESFAQDITLTDNAELCAVAARDGAAAKAFAQRYQIDQAYAGYQALFDDPNIDAVYIATPPSFHLSQAQAILERGKAVLCEKPLTTTVAECQRLLEIAQSSNAYLMEGMWTYFLPAIQKAQQWVAAGRIGHIRHIKVDFGYPQLPYDISKREYDKSLGGGCLLEMGIYTIALTHLFLQQDPSDINVMPHITAHGVEDEVNMLFNYHDDVYATLGTSFRCKLQNSAYIIGEDNYIAIPDFWRASECFLYELDRSADHYHDQRAGLGFNFEIASVSHDILAGKTQSDVVPQALSLKFQQYIERIKQHF